MTKKEDIKYLDNEQKTEETIQPIKKTILVVDDDKINRQVLYKILSSEYEVLEAENGKEAIEIMHKLYKSISAVLLDIVMPIMNGYEVLEEVHRDAFLSMIPVIVTTVSDNIDAEIKALSLGAHDFLTKPYKPLIIKHRLANTIKLRETAAFVNAVERDELTKVLSKEFFYKRAEAILQENIDKKYDIVCCDIERFKLVNDLFGIKVGDELLEFIAKVIIQYLGDAGICGRIGVDKFACLVIHHDSYKNSFFEEIIKTINQFPVNIILNVSFGIYTIEDAQVPVNVMCDRALLACNDIKGKYDVHFTYYDKVLRQSLLSEQTIIDGMKNAIVKKQFQVYYQPKYDINTEKVAGAEALVRWIHPEKGFMSPAEFIPLFEKNGFITELDIYVWDKVCKDLRKWMDAKRSIVPISVNVSRTDIYNPNLPKILSGLIEKYKIESKYLHLEITETAYTENPSQLIGAIGELKKMGFIIEMDDFGSGYSSLNMLSELPIDILKLDMKFIQNEAKKNSSKSILSFVICLAKWLDLEVVAEGVETKQQIETLRNMDCNYVQGYYYAKPMEIVEFEVYLQNNGVSQIEEGYNESAAIDNQVLITRSKSDSVMMIIDDIELNRTILSEIFSGSYTIVEASNGEAAYQYIKENMTKIDIILLDLVMPIMDGFHLLETLKNDEALKHIPVIVTSQGNEESEAQALSMGASDFISKPYNPEVALHRVKNVMAQGRLEKLEEKNFLFSKMQEMERKAKTDGLTSLYNRTEFETQITAFFHADHVKQSTFIILDIDNFKLVNDRLGHVKGDEAIQEVAEILKACFREEDLLCRMGGDEFSVFVKTKFTQEDLNARLTILCNKLKFMIDGMCITCSIGACVSPTYGNDYQTLYQNADMALLTAKRLGKNQYQIFTGEAELPSHILFRNMDWLMDEASDAVIVCDAESYDLLYLNDVACKIPKKSKRECMGKKCYEALWNRTEPCVHCVHISKLSKDYCEHEATPEGTNSNFIIKGKLVDWGGRAARIQYIQDNTGKAAIAKELSYISEDRKRLLDLMPGGSFRYRADESQEFDFISKNTLQMLGYTREEFEEKFENRFYNMVWGEDRERIQQEIKSQILIGDTNECEYRIEKKDGTLCWVYDVGRLVLDENRDAWFYVTIIDITQQRGNL